MAQLALHLVLPADSRCGFLVHLLAARGECLWLQGPGEGPPNGKHGLGYALWSQVQPPFQERLLYIGLSFPSLFEQRNPYPT